MCVLFGITIGSFLNAVIYRLGQNPPLSLLEPKTSICPSCRHALNALDLVPLFSFLLLGRKCRYCRKPISWRYFGVELLTGVLFLLLFLRFPQPEQVPVLVAALAFAATLVPVFFIDLATFTIPNSLNILLLVIPVSLDLYDAWHHVPGHALMWGWMPLSVEGAVAGVLIFGSVRIAGWLWKGIEAMGLGDVLLARGMGAMLVNITPAQYNPLRLQPAWVLLACLSGIVVGPALIWVRRRSAVTQDAQPALTTETPDAEGREGSMRQEAADILWCLVLGDVWDYLRALFGKNDASAAVEEEPWTPAPTAIPFGPFLVVGFLLTLFAGNSLTAAYLQYALGHVH